MIFQLIRTQINLAIKWLFTFQGNDIQLLIWSGVIAALLVFVIEYLRKPRVKVSFLDCNFDFDLPSCDNSIINSKNWKFEIEYPNSILNKLLFRYSLNNLKAQVSIYNKNLQQIANFQAKPDFNPNVYQERDVSAALSGINLTKGESDQFPFINKSSNYGWLFFEVWQIFLCQNRTRIGTGIYFVRIDIVSDQSQKVKWTRISLNNNELIFQKLTFFENLKLKFYG